MPLRSDDEDVGDREEGRVLGEDVAGPKLLAVIAGKGAPGLVTTGRARDHVPADSAGGVLDPELGSQFLGDMSPGNAGGRFLKGS